MTQPRLRVALLAGILDQGTASLLGLTLTVVTGRTLGAQGLGSVALALAVYLVVAGFHRGLVLEPLAVQAPEESGVHARAALTGALLLGATGTAAMWGLSLVVGSGNGVALAAFAPWVTAALVVETARVIGFRGGRTTIGMSAHVVWLTVMAGLLAATAEGFEVTDAALAWGTGAVAGAAVACLRLRRLPARPGDALAWWRTAWPFGRWLALQTSVFTLGIQGASFAVGIVAGTGALGSLKAVQTVFAPLTLLLPAVNLPALPVVARTLRASKRAARSLTARITVFLCVVCGGYLLVVVVARGPLLELAFGSGFDVPSGVVWPVALEQLVVAGSIGSFLMLKAAGDGRSVFVATAAGAGTTFAAVIALATLYGAAGAAWGMVSGAAAATAVAFARARAVGKDVSGGPVHVTLAASH